MKHKYKLSGAKCSSCKEKIEKSILELEHVNLVTVNNSFDEVEVIMSKHIGLEVIQDKLNKDYSEKYQLEIAQNLYTNKLSYYPLILVLSFTFLGTVLGMFLTSDWTLGMGMRLFMGLFFIEFSFFKLLDIPGFAASYLSYDIVAKAWKGWGYVYPFIELSLGILYIVGIYPFWVNIITILVMGVSIIGVIKSVLHKRKIKCVCLGTGFNLPMSTVTIIEDASMILMAIWMLAV